MALEELLIIIDQICKKEFSENKILIRGAIAKGEFERMPAVELTNLSKGLMVGQAYVDAYALEDTAKVAGVLLTEEVCEDMAELECKLECTEEKTSKGVNCIMRYLDYEYFSNAENMRKYIDVAIESNWLPHYYNTLYCAIKSEKNAKKVSDFFENIIINIGDPSEYWQEIDKFIKNAFDKDVIPEFQKRFLKYLRENITTNKHPHPSEKIRIGNKERVLKFIEERGDLTISQISSTLGVSHATIARIIRGLTNEGLVKKSDLGVADGNGTRRSVNTYSIK